MTATASPKLRKTAGKQTETSRELREIAHRLASTETAYISHPRFTTRTVERWLESQRPVENVGSTTHRAAVGIAFIPGLVAAPLLTPAEEQYLFLKMNYSRFRAERLRRKIDPEHPDPAIVRDVQALLAEALRLRNRIAEANVRLVVAAAKKLSRSVDQMSDLIGEGMPPLLRAIDLFDVHRGHRFSTYATWAVRNQMIRTLKRQGSRPETSPLLTDSVTTKSDEPFEERSGAAPEQIVTELMQSLTDRERQVISRRFGLHGHPAGESLAAIAGEVGLSKERVRQLAAAAVEKMRLAAKGRFELRLQA